MLAQTTQHDQPNSLTQLGQTTRLKIKTEKPASEGGGGKICEERRGKGGGGKGEEKRKEKRGKE